MKLVWVSFMPEHMGPGGSSMDQIFSLVPNGSTYESDPIWNHTVQVLTSPVQTDYIHTIV